jgi:hypothetical protein
VRQTDTNWLTYTGLVPTAYGPLAVAATTKDVQDARKIAQLHAYVLLAERGGLDYDSREVE